MVLVWRIMDNSPSSPNFPPAKHSRYMVIATVFNSSSQHLLITVHFTVQLLLVGCHSALFNSPNPGSETFYACQLYFTPSSGRFYCTLSIEMLFQNLALHAQISDFHCPLASQQLTVQTFHAA